MRQVEEVDVCDLYPGCWEPGMIVTESISGRRYVIESVTGNTIRMRPAPWYLRAWRWLRGRPRALRWWWFEVTTLRRGRP